MEPFYKGATSFFPFSLPICRATADYKAVFKNYLDDADTNNLIESVTQTRAVMASAMISKTQTNEQKLEAVDQYFKTLYRLFESLLAQGGVKVSQPLSFEWILYISGNNSDVFRSADMVFELIMLLHLRAQLFYCMGRALLDTDTRSFLSEASKHFLSASSIMDFLHSHLIPERWGKKLHHSLPNPPEALPGYCLALSLYYRTCAQVCASLKALDNPSASAMVRSRVAVAVANVSSRLVSALVSLPGVPKALPSHAACLRELFLAVAYWQLAQHAYDKQDVGAAMGCVSAARSHLSEQTASSKHDVLKPGLPKAAATASSGTSSGVQMARALVLRRADEVYAVADRDNRFVHFQTVSVPGLPDEALVMAPLADYRPPPADALVAFQPNVRTSFLAGLFGRSGGSGGSGSSGAGAGARTADADKDGAAPQTPALPPASTPASTPAVYPGLQPPPATGPSPGATSSGVHPGLSPGTSSGVYPGLPPGTSSGVYPGLSPGTSSGVYPGLQPPGATAPPPASQYVYNQNSYYTAPPHPPGPAAGLASAPPAPHNPYAAPPSHHLVSADEAYAREVQAQLDREAAARR